LVPHGDSAALAEAVIHLLEDGQLRETMGRAGRDWAAAHKWDNSADLFLKVVASHLAGRAETQTAALIGAKEAVDRVGPS
jgi:glycosyltransferase involved in cell wall biosynthesis